MKIEQYIDKLCAKAVEKKLEFQVYYKQDEANKLQVFEQKISVQKYSDHRYLNFKVRINGKIGKVALEKFDEHKIDEVIAEAVANAQILELDEEFFFYDGSGEYHQVKPYEPLSKVEELDKIEYLMSLEKLAYEADERINKVVMVNYNESKSDIIMRNSLGLDLHDSGRGASAYIYLSATDGQNITTAGAGTMFDKIEDFNPQILVDRAVKKAVSGLNAIDIASIKGMVVFENKVFAEFLGAMKSVFDAYMADIGKSKYQGKIGELVAAPEVNIIDDPWLEGGYNTSAFDGEGVPTKYKKVIENGVLKTFLCGMCMAHKYGIESTGNGTGGLSSCSFNFYLEAGKMPKYEVLSAVGKSVYINKLNGTRTGVNITSGDFSIGAEGFMIEDGKLTKALKQFTVSGNVYEVLKDIKYIGNDLEFYLSDKGSPTVGVDNITIAGI